GRHSSFLKVKIISLKLFYWNLVCSFIYFF
ncbi:MAG: hypothetical protein ACI9E5_000174, partial [Candidatus Omnitrophota bacterium]